MNEDDMVGETSRKLLQEPQSGGDIHAGASSLSAASAVSRSYASSTKLALSPLAFTNWIRAAERKLLTSAAQGRAPHETQITGLLEALAAKHESLALSDTEWKVWCALTLWQAMPPVSGSREVAYLELSNLCTIIDLHQAATRCNNGSALQLSSYITFVQLILSLHYLFEGHQRTPPTFWEDNGGQNDSHWVVEKYQDVLQDWTGLQDGPLFVKLKHHTAPISFIFGYTRQSLRGIPTREQARIAGTEDAWNQLLGEENVRILVREAISRASGDMNWSHLLWNALRDFETFYLCKQKSPERVEAVKQAYLSRLRVPHRTHEETAQAFSSFVSQFLPPDAYEKTMLSVQKAYGTAKALWFSVENYEDEIRASCTTTADVESVTHWQAWSAYLKAMRSQRQTDADLVSAVFERCIAFLGLPNALPSSEEDGHPPEPRWETDFKNSKLKLQREERFALEKSQRDSLRQKRQRREGVFMDYLAFLTTVRASASQILDVVERSVRCLPSSGALWATYLRQLARLHRSKTLIDKTLTRALDGEQCLQEDRDRHTDDVESSGSGQVIELLVGRIDAERELAALSLVTERGIEFSDALAQLPSEENRFMEIFALISYALSLPVGQKRPAAAYDQHLRLQRIASAWSEAGGPGITSLAEAIWETALGQQPTNGRVWLEAASFYLRMQDVRKARSLFRQGADRPKVTERSQILDGWKRFESVYGSADDISRVDERIRRETERQWEKWAQYQQQYAYAAYAAGGGAGDMDIDGKVAASLSDSAAGIIQGQKRKGSVHDETHAMEVEPPPSREVSTMNAESKRGRQGDHQPARDRENSSVLVADLPSDATMRDLQTLFADCGAIREISDLTVTGDSAIGVVEFMDRSSIAAAKTKDKKRVRGREVNVSLGCECTLYVTNFPPEYDDAAIKALFGNYGTIHNVRWPSKRFDQSRRFCYVQFARPREAREAQSALHQHSLTPGMSLQVYLSDPSRRKQRTDANANDRELFVTGISKRCSTEEVQSHFDALGDVEGFRMPRGRDGEFKGIAFVDYRTPIEAQRAAAELNGTLVGGKAVRVQLADSSRSDRQSVTRTASSVGSPSPISSGGTGKARLSDSHTKDNPSAASNHLPGFASRSVKVRGLPPSAQEPLIQQLFERAAGGVGKVRKVEWTPITHSTSSAAAAAPTLASAIVEFEDAATAGRVTLMSGQIAYGNAATGLSTLTVLPLERSAAVAAVSGAMVNANSDVSTTAFVPRASMRGGVARGRGRGRGAIGAGALTQSKRTTGNLPSAATNEDAIGLTGSTALASSSPPSMDIDAAATTTSVAAATPISTPQRKNQDAFRDMLNRSG